MSRQNREAAKKKKRIAKAKKLREESKLMAFTVEPRARFYTSGGTKCSIIRVTSRGRKRVAASKQSIAVDK